MTQRDKERYWNTLFARIVRVSPQTIRFITPSPDKVWKRIVLVIPIVIWSALIYQTSPLILRWQIDILTKNWNPVALITDEFRFDSTIPLFISIVVGYAVIKLINSGLQFLKTSVLYSLDREEEGDLENKFRDYIQQFEHSFLAGYTTIQLIRNLQSESYTIRHTISQIQSISIELLVAVITLTSILVTLHPLISGILLVLIMVSVLIKYIQSNVWRKAKFIESSFGIQSRDLMHQLYTKITLLIGAGWFDRVFDIYEERRAKWNKVRIRQYKNDALFNFATSLIGVILETGVYLVGGVLLLMQYITLGTFTVLGLYIERINTLIYQAGELFRLIVELRYVLVRLDYVLQIKPKFTDGRQNMNNIMRKGIDIVPTRVITHIASITLIDVDFSYPPLAQEEYKYIQTIQTRFNLHKDSLVNQELGNIQTRLHTNQYKTQPVLHKYSQVLQSGTIYQLRGKPGSGKTTLTHILKRSLEPDSGILRVQYTDNDISNIAQSSSIEHITELQEIPLSIWQNSIGSIVADTSFWSSLRLREVLSLGLLDVDRYSDSDLIAHLGRVGIVATQADLDKIIGESIDYSKSQRLLVDFARLLLEPKPLIMIDEAILGLSDADYTHINTILQTLKQHAIILIKAPFLPLDIHVDSVLQI